jgi:L-fucose mutarotase
MMQPDGGDAINTDAEADFMNAVRRHTARTAAPVRVGRRQFYERAKAAFAVVMTGELRPYGNLILKKGVTPIG